jgi:hypothetical protein
VNAAIRTLGHGALFWAGHSVLGCGRLVLGLYAGPNVLILVLIFLTAKILYLPPPSPPTQSTTDNHGEKEGYIFTYIEQMSYAIHS